MTRTVSGRLALGLLALFVTAGTGFTVATWLMAARYQDEVSQKLNLTLAAHVVRDRLPIRDGRIHRPALEEIFDLLVLTNPRIEIYLLDLEGRILAYSAPPGRVIRKRVAIEPIREFLSDTPSLPVRGDDPRSPTRRKVFSASPVPLDGAPEGYLYIILAGEQYDSIAAMLRNSYVLGLGIWGGVAGIGATLLGAFVLVRVLTRRLRALDAAMEQLRQDTESGGAPIMPHDRTGDEIDRLADTFSRMAERIASQVRDIEAADALRRRLVASVSHDLRTPLASIQGYLETLLLKADRLTEDERHAYLQSAARQSRHVSRLVRELFELARLDSPETTPALEPFSPGELLQDVAQKFRLEAEERGVRIDVDFGRGAPSVVADIGLIERVLSNLVENGLRHTPAGGTVRLSLRRQGDDVEITVADTGVGIPGDAVPLLFDRSFQVERSRRSGAGRAGLGLAIVKRILDLHGSTPLVSSVAGAGTRFSFRLRGAAASAGAGTSAGLSGRPALPGTAVTDS